ncbi:hypothetical protein PybrP1_004582 [[Pythium] brassicae (nom. inval.)]|nr:hypothetical protein PybrP1_004582 [[Pythium] brassicae (nom. inval.)]
MESAAPSSFSSPVPALHLSPAPPPPRPPPPTIATTEEAESVATELARLLGAMGTKLVCIDFDATLVGVHTGGTWTHSAADLHRYVRPLFLELVPRLVRRGVHVAVVTFSPQVQLIRQVLALAFAADVARRLILRGDDASWQLAPADAAGFAPLWQTGGRHLDRSCKLPFVISAALQAAGERRERVRNRDTLLFDDDAANVRVVNDSGIAGVYFDPQLETDFPALLKQVRRFHATAGTQSLRDDDGSEAAATASGAPSPLLPASASPTVPASPQQTPSKKQPTARMVRLMASPESRFIATSSSSSAAQLRHRGHGSGSGGGVARTSRFHLCTPSPVMKLRSTVEMGRPRSKRSVRLMRNIESDLQELHLPATSALCALPAPALKSTPTTLLMTLDELPTAPSSPPLQF